MRPIEVPDDFPHDDVIGVVPGAQPKLCVRESEGRYVARQTAFERAERWSICEDLAQQLVPKVVNDAMAHPGHCRQVTLERVRAALERKGWVSGDELAWLISRLRTLLNW